MALSSADGGGDRRARQGAPRGLAALNASAASSTTHGSSSGSGSGSGSVGDAVVGSSSTSASLASKYGDESSSASSDADLMYRRTQGSCAYYPVNSSGCRAPRSCFDCLNYDVAPDRAVRPFFRLAGGVGGVLKAGTDLSWPAWRDRQGCMVNERGQCVSMTGNYTAARDYHYATAANAIVTASGSSSLNGNVDISAALNSGPGAEFPAANATYCSWSDAKCAACRDGDFLEFSAGSITRTSLFCLGQDDCVCIALCELDDWSIRVGGKQCTNTTGTQAGSGTSSDAGDMTPVNSGAGGDSTRGGVAGQGDSDDESGGLGSFWSAASGVLAVLAITLAVVMYMSKRHRQSGSRNRHHLGTPQAPTLSPRRDNPPPESLIAALLHRSNRRGQSRRTGSTTAENSTDAETTEGDTSGDDGRSLRLFGWQAMRQQVIEKETLHPVVVSSGIRRVAISHCLPGDPSRGDAVDSECVLSPRSLPAIGHNEEDELEHAILGGGSASRRFTMMSLSSSAMLSPPSYVIPFEDENDDGADGERDHELGNGASDCFGELVTPPARSRILL